MPMDPSVQSVLNGQAEARSLSHAQLLNLAEFLLAQFRTNTTQSELEAKPNETANLPIPPALASLAESTDPFSTDSADTISSPPGFKDAKHPSKSKDGIAQSTDKSKQAKKRPQRPFEHHKCHRRHIALHITYLGWNYYGLAAQDHVEATIEGELFKALIKSCLIESRELCDYGRCGRTDRGVSAMGQVVSLTVRSNLGEGLGVIHNPLADNKRGNGVEVDYLNVLNRLLPDDIRVLAWAPAPLDFNARFSCRGRTYKYYFLRRDLDIDAMKKGAEQMVGIHDFQNLCKPDLDNGVRNFVRQLFGFEIRPTEMVAAQFLSGQFDPRFQVFEMVVHGTGFLYHQIRCLAAILFMIGEGTEKVTIVSDLMDVEKNTRKPAYELASDLPLVFHKVEYEDLQWEASYASTGANYDVAMACWQENALKTVVTASQLAKLDELHVLDPVTNTLKPWSEVLPTYLKEKAVERLKKHTPLAKRPASATLEDRVERADRCKRLKMDAAAASSLASTPEVSETSAAQQHSTNHVVGDE